MHIQKVSLPMKLGTSKVSAYFECCSSKARTLVKIGKIKVCKTFECGTIKADVPEKNSFFEINILRELRVCKRHEAFKATFSNLYLS